MSVEDRRKRMAEAARLAKGRTQPVVSTDNMRWLDDLRAKPNKTVAELAIIHYLERGGTAVKRG